MRAVVAILGVLALAVVGYLVWPRPPGPVMVEADTSASRVVVTVRRPRVGVTDVVIVLSTRAGEPQPGAFVRAQAVMPLLGYATPQVAATTTGDGRYTVAGVHLMTTGPWELRLEVTPRDGRREDLILNFDVTG